METIPDGNQLGLWALEGQDLSGGAEGTSEVVPRPLEDEGPTSCPKGALELARLSWPLPQST